MLELIRRRRRFSFIATIGVVAIFAAVFFIPEALAQTDYEQFSDTLRLGQADIRYIIARLIRYAIALVGIIFLAIIVYGGFLFMTSKGEPEKINKAKDVLKNGVIGLAIVLASYAIVSFIISTLLRAGLLGEIGSSSQPGVEVLSGSLGSGIIEDHWPLRNASDIARNTNIMITFKEAISIESFADVANQITGADTEDPADDSWYINADYLKIYPILDGVEAALPSEGVVAAATLDRKIWVFNPVEYLGSSLEEMDYSVALLPGIMLADGTPAFTGFNDDGYLWSFEVSTEIDSTPPYITSVGPPDESTRDRNIVVQINFSEAIDPTSATGVYYADDAIADFTNILVQESALQDTYTTVDGTWSISNGYKTVEFVTFEACGEDPCGDTIYCLPGNSYILTEASAATLSDEPPMAAGFPYDGVVDTCANSLDGDADGIAEGPEIDDYDWEFYTTNDINDITPSIHKIEPDEDEEEIELDATVGITFVGEDDLNFEGVIMMSSTLNTENIEIIPLNIGVDPEQTWHESWYRIDREDLGVGYQALVFGDDPVASKAVIDHMNFLESVDPDVWSYYTAINEGVKSSYQICFFPSEGPGESQINPPECGVTNDLPSCCHKAPDGSCYFPEEPAQ